MTDDKHGPASFAATAFAPSPPPAVTPITNPGAPVGGGQPQSGVGPTAVAGAAPQANSGPIGRTIHGRYKIKRLLGEGGMGGVYEGEHLEIGKRVAIKLVHALHARDPHIAARIKQEARSTGAIESENIVQVFDAGEDPELGIFLVMEMLKGEDLGALLARKKHVSPMAAATMVIQAAQGLSRAHAAGIVHRDLKPANIFLCTRDDGSSLVKLVDFGIAKLVRDANANQANQTPGLTRMGMVIGTPQYMSPEQAQGLLTVDHRTDIYSLGAVLFEAMVGKSPYPGDADVRADDPPDHDPPRAAALVGDPRRSPGARSALRRHDGARPERPAARHGGGTRAAPAHLPASSKGGECRCGRSRTRPGSMPPWRRTRPAHVRAQVECGARARGALGSRSRGAPPGRATQPSLAVTAAVDEEPVERRRRRSATKERGGHRASSRSWRSPRGSAPLRSRRCMRASPPAAQGGYGLVQSTVSVRCRDGDHRRGAGPLRHRRPSPRRRRRHCRGSRRAGRGQGGGGGETFARRPGQPRQAGESGRGTDARDRREARGASSVPQRRRSRAPRRRSAERANRPSSEAARARPRFVLHVRRAEGYDPRSPMIAIWILRRRFARSFSFALMFIVAAGLRRDSCTRAGAAPVSRTQ